MFLILRCTLVSVWWKLFEFKIMLSNLTMKQDKNSNRYSYEDKENYYGAANQLTET